MGLQKGTTNNPNGRPPGRQNKTTEQLRNTVQTFIENNIENLQLNFDLLEPKEKLLFIEKMLNYCLPRVQSTQLTGNDGKGLIFNVSIKKKSDKK